MSEERPSVDAAAMLVANLALIERAIAFTCRRQRLDEAEAEEFASTVKLKLVENNYAIVRKFEGRSSFATYITVVVQRILLDYRIHCWGKWHPSAEAKRLGDTAVEIEKIVVRDGRTVEDAFAMLLGTDPALTLERAREIVSRLPARPPKRATVELSEAAAVAIPAAEPFPARRRQISDRVSELVRRFIDELPAQDRLVLQLRFDGDMTVARIARSMQLDQKQLYRRIEKLLRDLRESLRRDGIDGDEAAALIGDRGVVLDFRLGNGRARPSTGKDETITPGQEEVTR